MPTQAFWRTSRYQINLGRPQVMGIVNVTPDSFFDGGAHFTTRDALRHCERLILDGADILDIGGESSRPGAAPLGVEEELLRIGPVVQEVVRWGIPIAIDTYKPQVMQAMLDAGVDIVNDIWALRWGGAPNIPVPSSIIAAHPHCGVCLMHMHRDPQTMQIEPMHGDAVPAVHTFLQQVSAELVVMGVARERIVLDPGIGFGKTAHQNFSLLQRQCDLLDLGYPLLVGWSRKSSLANLSTGAALSVHERLPASLAAAVLAVERGARIVRVHDVRETVQALRLWMEVRLQGGVFNRG
ncbi:dihydropteroate synthase [Candidatus Symbiobacter mobilis]|uniref:Dihydropteroate synthase n=1 Tax=Candidatus Symbiobacter mobilis CR TaxID=946483 RepID=U5N506_9BURK|nr:dihydropteroate synthase [Candidatus Symbiobacter mobilis]AGX86417.1 dihydropteroate synthase [Candidatus Symbiobacter mobilis CR]